MSQIPNKIDHIGIAVSDLKQAIATYTTLLGKSPDHLEDIEREKVQTAFFALGDTNIELLQATSPESPIAKYIEKQGRGGIHHICIEVGDIVAKLEELKANGVQLIDEKPKKGAHNKLVAFVHPKSMGGILVELSQSQG